MSRQRVVVQSGHYEALASALALALALLLAKASMKPIAYASPQGANYISQAT